MNICKKGLGFVLTVGFFSMAATNAWATWDNDKWQKITVTEGKYTVRVNGKNRDIYPGCATNGDKYSFYFKPGNEEKLVIFFNGGGACWNHTTCVASLNTQIPAYIPTASIPENKPQNQDGLFNLRNRDNPYRKWSMLYLPYCTGDIHIGSKDKTYAPEGVPDASTIIRHRGFDNFLYARDWIMDRYRYSGWQGSPDKILVTGSSAGAYGAALNYPYIKQAFPRTKGYMLADAGNGVITDSFLQNAFNASDASWGADKTLAPWIPGFNTLPTMGANNFAVATYGLLTSYYPKDRFAQFTTAWDATQVFFYNIMLNPNNIQQWPNLTPQIFTDWATTASTYSFISASASNYRFNIAPSCHHTVLSSERFYSLNTQGVAFVDWLHGMTSNHRFNWNRRWDNLSCNPGIDCPPPSTAEVSACLQMTPTN